MNINQWLAFLGTWIGIGLLMLIVVLPCLLIWSVNTLFDTGIAYSPQNWFAALLLLALVRGGSG